MIDHEHHKRISSQLESNENRIRIIDFGVSYNSFQSYVFLIPHSPFIIHHSSFIIHHSSFTIHHSPFIIHHSSFIIHHLLGSRQSTEHR